MKPYKLLTGQTYPGIEMTFWLWEILCQKATKVVSTINQLLSNMDCSAVETNHSHPLVNNDQLFKAILPLSRFTPLKPVNCRKYRPIVTLNNCLSMWNDWLFLVQVLAFIPLLAGMVKSALQRFYGKCVTKDIINPCPTLLYFTPVSMLLVAILSPSELR